VGQYYQNLPAVQVRTDTYHRNYTQDWGLTRYITDDQRIQASIIVQTLMKAAQAGLVKESEGSWLTGGSLVSGCTDALCSLSSYIGRPYHFVITGAASGTAGAFRFNVPAPPEGVSNARGIAKIYLGGDLYKVMEVPIGLGGGSVIVELPLLLGGAMPCRFHPEPGPWWYHYVITDGYHLTFTASLDVLYDYEPEDPCRDIDAVDTTWNGTQLIAPHVEDPHFQWGEEGDEVGEESETGLLTGLSPDTWYWYKLLIYCETKTFWFKTKKEDTEATWQASIITLPATEVWATGATIHGLFWYKGNSKVFVYLGFQWGLGSLEDEPINWRYSMWTSEDTPEEGRKYPIQHTIAGLMPDRMYFYRACLHVGPPPMNVNNYFGQTLSFGGPKSIFGFGRQYITARKAEDDITKLSTGRYYIDKTGAFQYESAKRREA